MSKSRGTFIRARSYLEQMEPDYLRYYFASRLGSGIGDLDLNLEDLVQKVNSDLVGKLVNIASRCAGFLRRGHDNLLTAQCPWPALPQAFLAAGPGIGDCYAGRDYARAMRKIMELADQANQFINQERPWELAREPQHRERVWQICSMGVNLFRLLALYLQPVLPATTARAADFLRDDLDWSRPPALLGEHRISDFRPLLKRLETRQVEAMLAAEAAPAQKP